MSSASRSSDAVVNATRSTNSTETSRRSAVAAGPAAAAARLVPHSPQNLTAGAFAAPHSAQVTARPLPHSPQNFLPASFAVPHERQTSSPTTGRLYSARRPPSHAGTRAGLTGGRRRPLSLLRPPWSSDARFDGISIEPLDSRGELHLLATQELKNIAFPEKSLMPDDYAQRLAPQEIENLLAFLSRQSIADRSSP